MLRAIYRLLWRAICTDQQYRHLVAEIHRERQQENRDVH